jgi:hypothetical protein
MKRDFPRQLSMKTSNTLISTVLPGKFFFAVAFRGK